MTAPRLDVPSRHFNDFPQKANGKTLNEWPLHLVVDEFGHASWAVRIDDVVVTLQLLDNSRGMEGHPGQTSGPHVDHFWLDNLNKKGDGLLRSTISSPGQGGRK